jgi:hypothetical protein
VSEEMDKVVSEAAPEFDSKIVPVMREAIVMVQMILYRRLKEDVQTRYQDWSDQEKIWIAGAVVNNLFGTEAADPDVNAFARQQRELIEQELRELKTRVSDLIPYLTDALRMQTICDNHEGIHSIPCLLMARELDLLDEERVLPMPSTFMIAVRRIGAEYGLVEAMESTVPLEDPPE